MNTLGEQLTTFNQNIRQQIPPKALDIMDGATEDLKTMKLEDSSLKTGDKIPEFGLPNHHGKTRSISDILSESPIVLTFYRGEWCPYCNIELAALQKALPEIEQAGAKLIAISPELPDYSLTIIEKHDLKFDILSDQDGKVQKLFGLEFQVPEALRPVYEDLGIDIQSHNGNGLFTLPVPATYIIDQTGTIRYHFVNVDYTKRAEPDDIVQKLKQMMVS